MSYSGNKARGNISITFCFQMHNLSLAGYRFLLGGISMKRTNQLALAAGMALAMINTGASATMVSLSGDTVEYSFDDSYLSGLFGSYAISGDTLSFSPTEFYTKQIGVGLALNNATTPLITVSAITGYSLTQLNLFEQGDYFRIQDGSDTTFVSVGGQFIVNDTPNSITASNALNTVTSIQDLIAGNPLLTHAWTANNSVDLNKAQSATAKVENILLAGVVSGSTLNTAYIEKKLLNIGATTAPQVSPTPVPLPPAFWMFGTAMIGLFRTCRKTGNPT